MKERYLDLMEKALSAYSEEHIDRYFFDVREKGLTEHGFPRLTANIGILIAHGRRRELFPLFVDMMEFCCTQIPGRHAANDFSVKEIALALLALENCPLLEKDRLNGWKTALSALDPWKDYDCIAPAPNVRVGNWAAYGAASEFMREKLGICDAAAFLARQIPSQLLSVDENGMYRDPHEPMLYDFATRSQFAVLLHFGYDGPWRDKLDDCLRRAGEMTLKMQSVTGEIPYGGRSNQFLFNEAYLAAVCEFEAARYAKEGNLSLAGQFRDAAALALDSLFDWMERLEGKRHIKNRFSMESAYGCEGYGYFDKYMISLASFIYLAYLFAADAIPGQPCPARIGGFTARTSEYFHKFFANCGGYFLEYDLNADPHYDASGLGRVHREGAPSAICLSLPCPSHPKYTVDIDRPFSLSLCPGIRQNGEWIFSADKTVVHEADGFFADDSSVSAAITCRFPENICVKTRYTVNTEGVQIEISGEGELAYMLPAFVFDGETRTEIHTDSHSLSVFYNGWICRYTTNGTISDSGRLAANRNGHYRMFTACGKNILLVSIEIFPA